MKIKMIRTIQGSLDGVTVRELKSEREYDTAATPSGDRLARYHIRNGDAVAAPAEIAVVPVLLARPIKASKK